MNLWWLASFFLISAMLVGALTVKHRDRTSRQAYRRFEEALQASPNHGSRPMRKEEEQPRLAAWLERFSKVENEEMQRHLVQAGWGSLHTRYYFLLAAWLGPAGAALAVFFYLLPSHEASDVLLYTIFAFALVFVFMRRLLRWRAQLRQKAIRQEVPAFLHLLRMLFDAGLSLEHILQVIEKQGGVLIPNLATELSVAIKRIQAGDERGKALAEMAAPLEVPELDDTILMLKQVTRYGGNIRDPLSEYISLVEQRQISELREYVSKLSAKMTVVMVVFLFPALMIFVAGPGFVGLAGALRGVGG